VLKIVENRKSQSWPNPASERAYQHLGNGFSLWKKIMAFLGVLERSWGLKFGTFHSNFPHFSHGMRKLTAPYARGGGKCFSAVFPSALEIQKRLRSYLVGRRIGIVRI